MSSAGNSTFNTAAVLADNARQLGMLLQQCFPSEHYPEGGCSAMADLFWDTWRQHSGLHEALLALVKPLHHALARTEPTWITSTTHPLWRALEVLQNAGIGYQMGLGRAGEKLLEDLERWATRLEAGDWQNDANALDQWWASEQNRISRLEQRLVDVELGQLRSRQAQRRAARLLNHAMIGKKLPASVREFLHSDWYQDLQWCLLQHGENGEEWASRTSLTHRLIESLQPLDNDPAERQKRYAVVPEVGPEFRALLEARAYDAAKQEHWLAHLEQQHVLLLRGQTLAYAPFEPLAHHDPFLSAQAQLSSDLLATANACSVGQWFIQHDLAPETRIKLVLKTDEAGQWLFVNRLGMKALLTAPEDFAYALASGAISPLPAFDGQALRNAVVEQLIRLGEQRVQAHYQAIALARERADANVRARIEARAQAIARERAQAEADRIASSVPVQAIPSLPGAPAHSLSPTESAATPEPIGQHSARQQVMLMPIGSWVELRDEGDAPQRLKLAVKLPSSGKLIFVDREGLRRTELTQDRFTTLLSEGAARILDQGPQFEDTLARVVNSLRRDRKGRD